MSTEYQGLTSTARKCTWARATASTGVKQASSFTNCSATTQEMSLWVTATPARLAAGAAGAAAGAAEAAVLLISRLLTQPSTLPSALLMRNQSPDSSRISTVVPFGREP